MKLKKLSSVALLGAAFSTSAMAHEMTFGAGLLSANLDSQYSQTVSTSANKAEFSATNTDLGGELSLGYVWTINRGFDLAFELFYDFTSTETKQDLVGATGHAKQSLDNIWGFRVLPGFFVTTNTKLFLDFGYASLDTTLDIKNSGLAGYSKTSASDTTAAYRYGAGVQTMIYDNFSLRMSYVIMNGASAVKIKSTDGASSVKAEPTVQVFAANLNYHFNF